MHQLARAVTSTCVVGGGWAGLAAAVRAVQHGDTVTLLEMAPRLGGRARRVDLDGLALDNGQHILIGAYTATLQLMRELGVDPEAVLERRPLELVYPDGNGLRLPRGAPLPAFLRGLLGARGWRRRDRMSLLVTTARWALAGFDCDPRLTVADLCAPLPPAVRATLIEPLCVAALNTPAAQASSRVFLRVLRDALFGGRGASDLLLPRRSLSDLLPDPAHRWLRQRGADVRLGVRATELRRDGDGEGWTIDGHRYDRVVLACSSGEAARLARDAAPGWAAVAAAFEHEPIITVYLSSAGSRLPRPMLALHAAADAPAQFVFDHGALGGAPGVFAAVVSGARSWVALGAEATAEAALRQLAAALPWQQPPRLLRTLVDKRATFLCTPGLRRPAASVAPGLWAAGDHVDGPYPATLEGAVRSGVAAADYDRPRRAATHLFMQSGFAMQK